MKVSVIGTGYVGLVTGATLSDLGNQVVCLDILEEKIDMLNSGKSPIFEPGLEELIQKGIKTKNLIGSIEIGKLADILLIEENPLENLKVLYGTGAIKLDKKNNVIRVGGVKYTIRDGVIFDSKQLLENVKKMVEIAKEKEGFVISQPGN